MQPQEIKALIEAAIAESQVEVSIAGSHVNLVVVSPAFEGMRPVQKQQLVYKALSEQIASGVIHAVNMQTLTPAEAG
ncbi:BolA/IbaG family iron-sulfur metabolism protein [Simiduia sp. 21SJ11W-1]|uniref:BolA family protein n=1 Tax=Simiduia sp. 21SJ11W-1 TaxID=2909669 RepID=UPI00209EF9AC|nr:BolA/IbaG family iron-sulfur metabolism protein [Simiduia sp. 21SJ11W-1]UTA48825.1 BolA/IbaG family iron-sulfur metabolism protein [Simiduia sp. 21SJ11W-1]